MVHSAQEPAEEPVGESVTEIDGLRYVLMDTASPGDRSHIHEQIKAFNDEISVHHRAVRQGGVQVLDIFIRDEEDRLCGGLVGVTYWGWLEVEDLWLDSSLRGQGIGRRLVSMAEAEARSCGCSRVWLRTYRDRLFSEQRGARLIRTGRRFSYSPVSRTSSA